MKPTHVINVDLAEVFRTPGRSEHVSTLTWGDPVEVVEITSTHVAIKLEAYRDNEEAVEANGYIVPRKSSRIAPSEVVRPVAKNNVLKVDFVDVQQGDG